MAKPYTDAESANVKGTALGCLGGMGTAGCLIPFGLVLCFTGIGAIVGIPLIVAGLLGLLLGPFMGLGSLKGDCPWCETKVTTQGHCEGFDCPACKKRIVVKDNMFLKID